VAQSSPAPAPIQQVTPAAPSAQASSDTWYTVKEGDSLWKIATEQCGNANAIPTIREMNKDTLKGDTVVLNMKLRLPNKVASAN
jgi:nucleoid-associated protein YgaU